MSTIAGYDASWGPVTEDRLTRDVTIVQRLKGHRFSSDDMITAFVAVRRAPHATRVLDLGCGIGSVLLHVAWSLPDSTLVGIEAQEISFALLAENVRRNQMNDRITIHHGDLRDRSARLGGPFELVTGTPPYFPPATALDAMDAQRAYARIEYRGGIDAYVIAGAAALAPGGSLVLCGDARTEERLEAAAREVGLRVVARTSIVASAPKPPLFAVWTLSRGHEDFVASELVLRDAEGRSTDDAAMLRDFSGFEPAAR
jgi:tRNA1Val (adenine37-N6)-methyltransferase